MPRIAPLALCGLLLAACTPPAGGPSPDGGASNRWLARVEADTAAGADSLAVWVKRGCGGLGGINSECVERTLYGVLNRSGVARAMGTLDVLAETEASVRRDAHPLAHGLGIAAYHDPQTMAATFAACPNTQISGCYHGVIQGYFLDLARRGNPLTAQDMNAVCAPHLGNGLLWGQCNHGLGHGLMALLRNQLPAVLDRCDMLSDAGAREGCYGGAFMENIVAVTHPEATAESHHALSHGSGGHNAHAGQQAAGHEGMNHAGMDHSGMDHSGMDHAAMGHGDSAAAAPWKPLDRNDPLYPCTVVAEKYRYQCYLIQTSAILPQMAGDIPHTAQACSRAPENMVRVCYASLGRDITAYAGRDPRKTAEMCSRAGPAAEPACVRGAAVSLVDVSQNVADGVALCALVPDTARAGCYEAVAGTLPINTPDPARREAVCAAWDAAYQAACRQAARIARQST
ncbi:MAG TPA: hypothetical protein VF705_09850, partial [Longimicrobium sp.]